MKKLGLIPKIIIGIILGVIIGKFAPVGFARIFATFSSIFANFLDFVIPLIIIGFIVAGIADLGTGAGKLLGITVLLAYIFTIVSGTYALIVGKALLPGIITSDAMSNIASAKEDLAPYFTIEMPPLADVISALIISFILGLGIAKTQNKTLKDAFIGVQEIISSVIEKVVIPLLPIHICGIFTNMAYTGQVATVVSVFWKVFIIIISLHLTMIIFQFAVGCSFSKNNLFKSLKIQSKAYLTAIGTQSSAATIPVNVECSEKMGISKGIREFVIPLCATVHLSGSTMTITTCAMAVSMLFGMKLSFATMFGFVAMLGVSMVAAPGVPGGAIMAALGLLSSMLGFSEQMTALMIALYIAQDSFGTACNVSGDQAVAMVVDFFQRKWSKSESTNRASIN
ncbi:MAG: dicarboxylate/amino acid:cation symporter [Clostridium thermopalmarium]|uniref:dicarboxylate/amino acid:cation symporter n=1 Tax=Clostridium thermopalmarium TaxID=29373 RepID=UPI002352DEB8|nr:dicarboxylate/amino acid:cation symporter [Clostridium thermopalmarium]MBE6043426.1 dicarboxylate/amino acid:cation symporter [Clostridium thermopalmarium]